MSSDAAYHIALREIRYKITPEGYLHYAKRLRLRALVDGPLQFSDKISWSAGDAGMPFCPETGFTVEDRPEHAGMWRHYRVRHDEPVPAGTEIEFGLYWPPLVDWARSRPFVSTTIDEPTDRVRFLLRIPDDLRTDEVAWLERLSSPTVAKVAWSAPAVFVDGSLDWGVTDVPVGGHLRVSWSWAPGLARRPAARSNARRWPVQNR